MDEKKMSDEDTIDSVLSAIVREAPNHIMKPRHLIDLAKHRYGFREFDVRSRIWRMFANNELIFTTKRNVALPGSEENE